MKPRTLRFLVEVKTTMSWHDTANYIADAVASWGGQEFPGDEENEPDPRFEIKEEDVAVKRLVRKNKDKSS